MNRTRAYFTTSFVFTAVLDTAAIASASGYKRIPASMCVLSVDNHGSGNFNVPGYSGNGINGGGGQQSSLFPFATQWTCPLTDDDTHPQSNMVNFWADFNVSASNIPVNLQIVTQDYTDTNFKTSSSFNTSGSGYTAIHQNFGSFFANNSFDYPAFLITFPTNGGNYMQGYGVGY